MHAHLSIYPNHSARLPTPYYLFCAVFAFSYRFLDRGTCSAYGDGGDPALNPLLGYHEGFSMLGWVGAFVGVTLSMLLLCPLVYEPKSWAIHRWLLPWIPALAIFLTLFR